MHRFHPRSPCIFLAPNRKTPSEISQPAFQQKHKKNKRWRTDPWGHIQIMAVYSSIMWTKRDSTYSSTANERLSWPPQLRGGPSFPLPLSPPKPFPYRLPFPTSTPLTVMPTKIKGANSNISYGIPDTFPKWRSIPYGTIRLARGCTNCSSFSHTWQWSLWVAYLGLAGPNKGNRWKNMGLLKKNRWPLYSGICSDSQFGFFLSFSLYIYIYKGAGLFLLEVSFSCFINC